MPDKPFIHDGKKGSAFVKGVGQRLEWVRLVIGWTQIQCAKVSGIDQSTWTKYEGGTRLAPIHNIVPFCERTGASLDFIYRGRIGGVMRRDLELRLVALHPELVLGAEAGPAREEDSGPSTVKAPAF